MNEQALVSTGTGAAKVDDFLVLESMTIEDGSDPLFLVKKMLLSLKFRTGLDDRDRLVRELAQRLSCLGDHELAELSSWCGGYFEKILSILRLEYGSENFVYQFSHVLRWGLDGVTKDVPFARLLLERYASLSEVLASPKSFPRRIVYNHSLILHERWTIAADEKEQKHVARLALPLFRHLAQGNDYIKSRAQYFLASAFLVLDDPTQAASWLLDAVSEKDALPSWSALIVSLLFKGHEELKPPAKLRNLILEGQRWLDPEFWDHLATLMPRAEVLARFKHFAELLRARGQGVREHVPLDAASETALRGYWKFFHACEYQSGGQAKSLGTTALALPGLDNASALQIYQRLAVLSLSPLDGDGPAAFFYANEALYFSYSSEMAVALQRAFLEADQTLLYQALFELQARTCAPLLARERALSILLRAHREPCWVTGRVEDEIPLLSWLATQDHRSLAARFAAARLASLFIRGECSQDLQHIKIQRYREAKTYLHQLSWNECLLELRKRLEAFGFYKYQAELIRSSDNGEYIWLETEGSDELIIAFADRFSYHVFPSVPSFLKHRKTNVLFVNNGACNWYSDDEESRVDALMRELVLPRFSKDKVTCYHGSMGGYGAIKFALKHGFCAITFNPQINLDLWALDRPSDADRLQAISHKPNLEALPVQDYEHLAMCFVAGSNPADAVAFQVFVEKLMQVENISLVLEKHPIREHEGIAMKIHGDKLVDAVTATARHLRVMKNWDVPPDSYRKLSGEELKDLVVQIKNKNSGKWELLARQGRWHIAP